MRLLMSGRSFETHLDGILQSWPFPLRDWQLCPLWKVERICFFPRPNYIIFEFHNAVLNEVSKHMWTGVFWTEFSLSGSCASDGLHSAHSLKHLYQCFLPCKFVATSLVRGVYNIVKAPEAVIERAVPSALQNCVAHGAWITWGRDMSENSNSAKTFTMICSYWLIQNHFDFLHRWNPTWFTMYILLWFQK